MQIPVTIPDEIVAQAKVRGLTPESCVENLVAQQKMETATNQTSLSPALSLEERMANLEKFFEEMSVHSDKIPILSDYALTRESIYSDHD